MKRSKATPKQKREQGLRFLYAWAALWRRKTRTQALLLHLKTDPHATPDFRVAAILNLPRFCEDVLSLAPGDPLFKSFQDRIQIW